MKNLKDFIKESFGNYGTDAQWEYGMSKDKKGNEDYVVVINKNCSYSEREIDDGFSIAKGELFQKFSKPAAAKYYKIFFTIRGKSLICGVSRKADVHCTWPSEKTFDNPYCDYSDDKCEKLLKKYIKELEPYMKNAKSDVQKAFEEIKKHFDI